MKRKLLIAIPIVIVLILFSGVHVLATSGVDAWSAYQEALKAGLNGLKAYFEFVIELFKAA